MTDAPHPFLGWITRHGLAAGAGLIWPPVAAAVLYAVLLLAAVVFNLGTGGPLALPAMVLTGIIYAVWAVFTVAWPAVAVAEWLVKSDGWRPALGRLALALAIGVALTMLWWPVFRLGPPDAVALPTSAGWLLAASAAPAVLVHWFIARAFRTVFTAGRSLGAVVARRWPGPGSGADAGGAI